MIDITKFDGHTAGPWQHDQGGWITTDPEDLFIGSVGAMRGRHTDTANAELIAAAPDLLAEVIRLRAALTAVDRQLGHDDADDALRDLIDAALKGGAA